MSSRKTERRGQESCKDTVKASTLNPEETDEKQKERVQRYENLGNEPFSEERSAEISMDPVLQARARLCDGKVDGPKRENCERNAEATTVGKSL